MTDKRRYSINLPQKASDALREMAREEGVTMSELIRRALNFYDVKMEACRTNKKIVLEDEQGNKQWVMV